MKHKSWLLGLALSVLLFAVPAYAYGPFQSDGNTYIENGTPLTVHVDGSYVSTDVPAFIQNDRTYLPVRAATESMGAEVGWDPATRTVSITKDNSSVQCTIDSTTFFVNGETCYSDVAPIICNDRTMLPIRQIAEALGGQVAWDGTNASVDIYTGAPVQAAPALPNNIPSELQWLVEKYYVAPTEPGVGSWYTTNDIPCCGNHKYVFISKMKDGTTNAAMIMASPNDPMPVYSVYTCDVDTMGNTYTLHPRFASGSTYFFGPPTGVIGDYSYYFDYDEGNSLTMTGFVNQLIGTPEPTPCNTEYFPI